MFSQLEPVTTTIITLGKDWPNLTHRIRNTHHGETQGGGGGVHTTWRHTRARERSSGCNLHVVVVGLCLRALSVRNCARVYDAAADTTSCILDCAPDAMGQRRRRDVHATRPTPPLVPFDPRGHIVTSFALRHIV